MNTPDVTQILVGGHRTGIVGLKDALTKVAAEHGGETDDVIRQRLVDQLSKANYIPPKAIDDYGRAFLREYRKSIGEPVGDLKDPGILEIKVLGPGCSNCERMEQEVMALMAELGLAGDLEHVRDPVAISGYGVMGSPGLIVNGDVKAVGRVPSRENLRRWLLQAAGK